MRIVIVDPRGETRPYDDALAAALAARGNDVELVTSAPRVAQPPAPAGVAVHRSMFAAQQLLADTQATVLRQRRQRVDAAHEIGHEQRGLANDATGDRCAAPSEPPLRW